MSKPSDECYSPGYLAGIAREVMGGIDLDPSSCAVANEVVRATRYYTCDDDGLGLYWFGRVWNNEPFSEAGLWIDKAEREYAAGRTLAICQLLPVRTGVSYWRTVWDYPILWVGRVQFWGPGALGKSGESSSSREDVCMRLLTHDESMVARFYQQGRLHGYRVTWDRPQTAIQAR